MPKKTGAKRGAAKKVLRLPDLDHSKTSVLQSLGSVASKRTYAFAINDFIAWYCSEPRLALGRTVVLRYRYELEARRLAPATINLRLAAVRRLAYEASDNGLLSPDLAASIRRVKGAKKLGIRLGNWLTCAQGRKLLESPDKNGTKGKRDHAILGLLLGCGLRPPSTRWLPMTSAEPVQDSAKQPVVSLSKFSSCWGTALWRPRNGISAPGRGSCTPSTISWASNRMPVRGE
jgi:integrase